MILRVVKIADNGDKTPWRTTARDSLGRSHDLRAVRSLAGNRAAQPVIRLVKSCYPSPDIVADEIRGGRQSTGRTTDGMRFHLPFPRWGLGCAGTGRTWPSPTIRVGQF